MKKLFSTIPIISIALFVAALLDVLPGSFSNYVLFLTPPAIILGLIFSAGGLTPLLKKILNYFCLVVFLVAVAFSIYYVFYSGEQGSIGVLFVWLFAGIACSAMYLFLLLSNLIKTSFNHR